MPIINIELKSKADLAGFRDIERATSAGVTSVAGFGAKLGLGLLGAQKAGNLLVNELRHVVENIDKIPGIPQETVDSINRAKFAISEARTQVDQWLAKGVTLFTQFGEGLGYLVGSIIYGEEAAASAFAETQRAANAAAEAAKNAKKLAEERVAIERQLAVALEKQIAARRELALVGEARGAAIQRLIAERQLALGEVDSPNTVTSRLAQSRVAQLDLEIKKATFEYEKRRAEISQKIADLEFERLSTSEKIKRLEAERDAVVSRQSAFAVTDLATAEAQAEMDVKRLDLEKQLLSLRKQLADEQKKAADATLSALESQAQRLQAERAIAEQRGDRTRAAQLLDQEQAALRQIAAAYRDIAANATDAATAEAARAKAAGIDKQLAIPARTPLSQSTAREFGERNNPENSFQSTAEGLRGGFLQAMNAIETSANAVAAAVKNTLGTAINGLSDGIYGLITRTKTWGQVWAQVGSSVLQHLIRMGVQILANKALGSAANAAAKAEGVSTGAAIASSNAPAAASASVASYGSAAVAGGIAAAAAIALIIGLLSRGFAEGGYTGDGAKYAPAGIVHRGEYVFDQASVQRLGIANLEALRFSSRLPGYAAGGPVTAAGSPSSLVSRPSSNSVILVDDEREARRKIYRSGEFRTEVRRISRRYRG